MATNKVDICHMEEINLDPGHDAALLEIGLQLYESELKMSLFQAAKANRRILFYCSAAFLVGAVFGYDAVANGATIAMPAFILYFGEVAAAGQDYLPSIWTSLWTAMSGLAQALGGFGIGFIIDRFGRKWTAVACSVLSIIGVAVQYTASTSGSLLAGKMINGVAIGALFTIGTSWASEISPPRLRGTIQSALILFQTAMQMVGLGVIRSLLLNYTPKAFRVAFAVQFPLAGLTLIIFIFVPESPVYLINRGLYADALASLRRLYGKSNSIDARFAHLLDIIRHENTGVRVKAGSYMDCFKGTNLRRTLTIIFILSGLSICGAQFLTQNIYFLILTGLPVVHVFDVGIGGFAVAIILIATSWGWIAYIGRRRVFLSASAISAIIMFVIGGLNYATGPAPIWVIAVAMNILIAYGALAFIATGWSMIAEISSYRLRGKSQAIGVITQAFFNWLFAFVTPYIYNVDSGNLGPRTGFVYGALSTLFFIGSLFLVPDTQGLSVAEVDWMYNNKISSRTFQIRKEEAKLATIEALVEE